MSELEPVEAVEEVVTDSSEPIVETVKATRPHFRLTGVFDADTIGALQFLLGVKQTRELDTKTVKALQKKLGLQQNGEWGRDLRLNFQLFLGVPASPTFDTRSVRALQKFLVETTEW